MITFGYVKDYKFAGDGTLMIRTRIPSVHGPYDISGYRGNTVRNYVRDDDLPYIQSVLLPHLPAEGEVVAISSMNEANTEFIIIGLTGGSYWSSLANKNG